MGGLLFEYDERIEQLEAEIERLKALLKRLEWRYMGALDRYDGGTGDSKTYYRKHYECPVCGKGTTQGHSADCELAAILKEVKADE